jgi:dCTP deaminase
MAIKNDEWIETQSILNGMISPFSREQVKVEKYQPDMLVNPLERKIVSWGLSSYGYDIRVSRKFKIFTNINTCVVDPKNFDDKSFIDFEGDVCIIPPNSFALGVTVERFKIPRSVLTLCVGKSTYARCGIIVNVTPFESEWEGYATIEISNTTPLPAKIYANEGIAQVLFFESDNVCRVSYADKKGKYQDQKQEITLAKV